MVCNCICIVQINKNLLVSTQITYSLDAYNLVTFSTSATLGQYKSSPYIITPVNLQTISYNSNGPVVCVPTSGVIFSRPGKLLLIREVGNVLHISNPGALSSFEVYRCYRKPNQILTMVMSKVKNNIPNSVMYIVLSNVPGYITLPNPPSGTHDESQLLDDTTKISRIDVYGGSTEIVGNHDNALLSSSTSYVPITSLSVIGFDEISFEIVDGSLSASDSRGECLDVYLKRIPLSVQVYDYCIIVLNQHQIYKYVTYTEQRCLSELTSLIRKEQVSRYTMNLVSGDVVLRNITSI